MDTAENKTGTTTGAIAPYTPPAGGPSTYYLGGGGGTLTIGPGPVLGPAAPLTAAPSPA